jgi:hypothetical protein
MTAMYHRAVCAGNPRRVRSRLEILRSPIFFPRSISELFSPRTRQVKLGREKSRKPIKGA